LFESTNGKYGLWEKTFFIVLSISAFSARAGNPPSMIDKAEEGV
jgi:hypothetical protein